LAAQPGQEIKRAKGNRTSDLTRAVVSTDPDAPVVLQVPHPESPGADNHAPEVEITITNTSDKQVSAYAIKYRVVCNGESRPGGVELVQSSTADSLMSPHDTRTVIVGGAHYSLPIEQIVVSVDFVEFTDGTSWGTDTYSSKEVLAGMRAGARRTAAHLLRVFTGSGANALSAELERVGNENDVAAEASEKWREGFQRGVAFIKERAKREITIYSPRDVERILTLPIDALDDIKKR
jgi:hypothetical protein